MKMTGIGTFANELLSRQRYSKGEMTTSSVKERLVEVLAELIEGHQVLTECGYSIINDLPNRLLEQRLLMRWSTRS